MNKKKQKNFVNLGSGTMSREWGIGLVVQKFFGSFFQKRTLPLFSREREPAPDHVVPNVPPHTLAVVGAGDTPMA